ncbi:MAG: hypothetical protein H7146_02510 [Burkholderiaceae bacterium]|nr:hypothetical protein [Microbacteriaceae bacterium]
MLPLFAIPGAGFPPWAPYVFGVIGLVSVTVLIWQAVLYFRNHDGDGDGE